MRVSAPRVSRSVVGYFLSTALFLVALIDGGSIVLSRLALTDYAVTVGHDAAQAVEALPVTQQTAVIAFEAAQTAAGSQGLTVRTDDFELYHDGRITLTVTRTAPTLLLEHVPRLSDLAQVSTTVTVTALAYS